MTPLRTASAALLAASIWLHMGAIASASDWTMPPISPSDRVVIGEGVQIAPRIESDLESTLDTLSEDGAINAYVVAARATSDPPVGQGTIYQSHFSNDGGSYGGGHETVGDTYSGSGKTFGDTYYDFG